MDLKNLDDLLVLEKIFETCSRLNISDEYLIKSLVQSIKNKMKEDFVKNELEEEMNEIYLELDSCLRERSK